MRKLYGRNDTFYCADTVLELARIGAAAFANRNMPDLAARTRLFAVEVQARSRQRQNPFSLRNASYQIEHDIPRKRPSAAERQPAQGANMILKLARRSPFYGPMATVMHPWGYFIGDESSFMLEKFDRQNTDVVECLANTAHGLLCLLSERRGDVFSRCGCSKQNSLAVAVLN